MTRYRIKNWHQYQSYKDGRRILWIKLYTRLLDDPEWHKLNGFDAKNLVNLWILASETDGELPPAYKVSFRLRITEKQATSLLSELSHWIDSYDDGINDKHSLLQTPTSLLQTPTNLYGEGEGEREGEGKGDRERAPKRVSKAETSLPEDLQLSQRMREFAEKRGLPDPADEFEQFKDRHRSKGSRFSDWEAAWRTWVRNYAKFAPRGNGNGAFVNKREQAQRAGLEAAVRYLEKAGSSDALPVLPPLRTKPN